jgi:hypothetical protein
MLLWQPGWMDSLRTELAARSSRAVPSSSPREWEEVVDVSTQGERPGGPISRIVGVYQIVLRRTLEHFFPSAQLEILGDRSIIDWDGSSDET